MRRANPNRRRLGHVFALFLAVASFALTPAAVAAAPKDAPVVVMEIALVACDAPPFSYDALRAKLALALRDENVRLAQGTEPSKLRASLFWECSAKAGAARIELQADDGAHLERTIDLTDVKKADRPAVIALAVAETVRALQKPPASGKATSVASVSTSGSSSAAPAPASAPAPAPAPASAPAPAPGPSPAPAASPTPAPADPDSDAKPTSDLESPNADASTWHPRSFDVAAELQRFFSAGPSLFGARADATFDRFRFGVAALTGSAHDVLGDASVLLLRGGVVWNAIAFHGRRAAFSAGPFVHVGRVSVGPTARGVAGASDAAELYVAAGVETTLEFPLGAGFHVGAGVDFGGARGLVARADDRVLVNADGGFVSALAFFGFRR